MSSGLSLVVTNIFVETCETAVLERTYVKSKTWLMIVSLSGLKVAILHQVF